MYINNLSARRVHLHVYKLKCFVDYLVDDIFVGRKKKIVIFSIIGIDKVKSNNLLSS